MKIKKALLGTAIFCFLFALLCAGTAFAQAKTSKGSRTGAGAGQRVFDEAGLFTTQEKAQLEEQLESAIEKSGVDLAVLTIDDAKGKTTTEFADDYYDEMGFGTGAEYSGALFVIDMDNREIYVTTSGKITAFLDDDRIERMIDRAYRYIGEEKYGEGAIGAVKDISQYLEAGPVAGQYDYDGDRGRVYRKRSIAWYEWIFALAASAAIALLPCTATIRQYRMEAQRKQALNYHMAYKGSSAFAFTAVNDLFINKMVTQRRIPRNTGGGFGGGLGGGGGSHPGRSTLHRSSSGRMHGGGGRKF